MQKGLQRSEARVPVIEESDVAMARRHVRDLASLAGMDTSSIEALATATSELARNILRYARSGEILLRVTEEHGRRTVVVVAQDRGPGIADIQKAIEDGYSTGSGLGLGLSSARRLVDQFDLVSQLGRGTTVTLKKWVLPPQRR
jgi:serine/threonine-protein kinase RsbT